MPKRLFCIKAISLCRIRNDTLHHFEQTQDAKNNKRKTLTNKQNKQNKNKTPQKEQQKIYMKYPVNIYMYNLKVSITHGHQ